MNEEAKRQLAKDRNARRTKTAIYIIVGICAILAVYIYIHSIPPPVGMYDSFAKCIAASGAQFYGASWCPHCHNQKAEFRSGAQYLPYVECSYSPGTQTQVCIDKGIQSYPTWYYPDGSSSTGETSLAYLSQKTGCALPGAGSSTVPAASSSAAPTGAASPAVY